jgi:uncharacterized protein involved in exopolysaccharide biosynthesis
MSEARDIDDLIRLLWIRRWWILLASILCASIFGAIAFRMTPTFRASVVVVPVSSPNSASGLGAMLGQLGGLASLAGVNVQGGDSSTQEALAVLRSREFSEKFLVENQLAQQFFASKWDIEKKTWKANGVAPTSNQLYDYFNKRVRSVVEDKKSGLITIEIEWRDRVAAANWANQLIDRLNAEMRTRAIDQANASIGHLEKELADTPQIEMRQAIARLVESQVKQRMLANVMKEYVFRIIDHAVPSDANQPVSPRKALMLIAGFLCGFFGASIVVLVRTVSFAGPLEAA